MGEAAVRRVLAAMVMADVAGYSRLIGADEAGTVSRLRRCRTECVEPTVRRFQGRVVDAVGDSMFFEFPSVVEAVRCAIALQQSIAERNAGLPDDRRLLLRMGINIGDVIIRDRALFGDDVNIAARLQALAEPGGICVSGSVFDQVRRRVEADFTALGPREVKNISRPIEVFSLSASAITATQRPVPVTRLAFPPARVALVAGATVLACLAASAVMVGWTHATRTALKAKLEDALATSQAKLTGHSRASLITRYFASGPHRAFALAPRVQDHWWTGDWPSADAAEEKVLERCQLRFNEPCALLALDDDVRLSSAGDLPGARDMPRLHYAGDFDAAQLPGVRPILAQRGDVVGYLQSPQPKAAAIHPRGLLVIVTGVRSQRSAETQALRQCNDQSGREGGGDCLLYAIGNRVVLPMRASAAVSSP